MITRKLKIILVGLLSSLVCGTGATYHCSPGTYTTLVGNDCGLVQAPNCGQKTCYTLTQDDFTCVFFGTGCYIKNDTGTLVKKTYICVDDPLRDPECYCPHQTGTPWMIENVSGSEEWCATEPW